MKFYRTGGKRWGEQTRRPAEGQDFWGPRAGAGTSPGSQGMAAVLLLGSPRVPSCSSHRMGKGLVSTQGVKGPPQGTEWVAGALWHHTWVQAVPARGLAELFSPTSPHGFSMALPVLGLHTPPQEDSALSSGTRLEDDAPPATASGDTRQPSSLRHSPSLPPPGVRQRCLPRLLSSQAPS